MTDTTAAAPATAKAFKFPALSDIGTLLRRGDLALAIGVMTILVVLILPLPPMVLDLLLAVSIIISVLILMTALFIQTPLEFSSFPTVLLIATMLRLALNLASTRLILSHGHEGTAAAGHVIEAFGNFVMSGNFVIGIIVFTILVIVNFVVITKGSGRIAEVAARFHLDAMPGKQMAIDADLSAGLIDETRSPPPAQDAGRRKRILRRHGRRLEIRARRRDRGPARRLHQRHRRHDHRHRATGHAVRRSRQDLHAADRRRRPRHAGAGVDRLDRRGLARIESRHHRRRRQGAGGPAVRLSESARPVVRRDVVDGATPRRADAAVPGARRRRRGARLLRREARQEEDPGRQAGRSRGDRCRTGRRADLGRAQDRRSQDRTRLRASPAGQFAGRQRPADRADQGAAQSPRDRDGFCDAGGAHPRQRPARGQHLRHQDQGSGCRQRQDLAEPVHGHGPGRRPGEPARHSHRSSRRSVCLRPGSTSRRRKKRR